MMWQLINLIVGSKPTYQQKMKRMHDHDLDQKATGPTRRAVWTGVAGALAALQSACSPARAYTQSNPTTPSTPPHTASRAPQGALRATITIPNSYTRRGVLQQAAGTYVFDEATGTRLQPWVDADGRFTMSRVARRVPGCLLRVYFCQVTDKASGAQPWRSVEFELGDWRGTGLGVNDRSGQPIPLNLNRYTIAITDANGTLATYNLTSNGCAGLNAPCAHGWCSGWRWTYGAWPYRRSIASLVAANLLPVMSLKAVPQSSGGGPASFTYPPAQPPNYILGMSYGPGVTGTGDALAGMMQGVHGSYCETKSASDLASMMAVADSGHNFPMMLRDLQTEALVDFWTTPAFNPGVNGGSEPLYWTLMDVLLNNSTSAPITVPNGNNSAASYVSDSGGQTYVIGNDQLRPNNPPIVVPANGSMIVTVVMRYAKEPTGTPSVYTDNNGTHVTYPGLSASYVANSLTRGSGTGNDSSHNPPFSYVPFLVTGDPYYLTGLHGLAVNAGYAQCNPAFPADGNGYHGNGRGSAWTLRDVMQAAQATPANAPSWLVSRASFQKTTDAIMRGMAWRTAHPSAPAVFHTMYDMHAVNDEAWWHEDYIHQAVAWCAMAYPDTQWGSVLDWLIVNPIARLNGTSGWCNSWPVYYKQGYGTSANALYASWAAMWAGETAPGGALAGKVCTVPGDMTKNCSPDYLGGLYAAVALAIQAASKRSVMPTWLADGTACKTTMVAAIRAAYAANTGWALSRKQGYA